ncbi:hypothetical protein [Cytobacillus oceanisediminis]|uniref:hypothetical protein n=1 Tax=Cytobacillus oceanisediminis TaxID=665099 RepID=UPI001C24E1DD|nr:hypothetical protein [Cytobacillus oceanisediminis]MBU8772060.1 hypothetical protein [Cytobacillus oceanisediminis]
MPFVEKDNMFITVPVSYRDYVEHREIKGPIFENYMMLLEDTPNKLNLKVENENLFFENSPRSYISSIFRWPDNIKEPEYLICCYKTYQMHSTSTALYIKKALSLKSPQAFSISDLGSLSPIIALEWARINKADALLVCLEQIYNMEISKSADGFPLADGASVIAIRSEGDFRILSYEQIWIKESKTHGVQETYNLIENHLSYMGIMPEEIMIIPQALSEIYQTGIKEKFPNVFTRKDKRNLSTADPFYSLEDICITNFKKKSYYALTFIEQSKVGVIILKKTGG